jgi:hypothetical protein
MATPRDQENLRTKWRHQLNSALDCDGWGQVIEAAEGYEALRVGPFPFFFVHVFPKKFIDAPFFFCFFFLFFSLTSRSAATLSIEKIPSSLFFKYCVCELSHLALEMDVKNCGIE